MGHHVLLNLYDCANVGRLRTVKEFRDHICLLLAASGAEVVDTMEYQFQPQGYTLISLLTTSHFSIHTWPEYQSAAVDIFTCGDVDTDNIVSSLIEFFSSGRTTYQDVLR